LADDRVALIARQVKDANDIVDVVGSYMALRPAGQTFKGLCPFHEDHRPSFDVDPRRQRYRCWSCQKYGDVITFVQEYERVDFRDAVEILARRAGITLEKKGAATQNRGRAFMLDVVRWAAEQFHQYLLTGSQAEAARQYVQERGLTDETVRCWGLGYAPAAGDWLAQRAVQKGLSAEVLEQVGLIGRREEGKGYYDRFRDRVMFPIRDALGRAVGFGGRILPSSPYANRAPKYYNSCDTPLFSKSEQLYGLDLAKHAAGKAGYLAVVEGYTDVLMAHQLGVPEVVATMGTALNARHVRQLKRFTPRVVLVFDADAGGSTGVDRALEVFVSQEVELAVATLPAELDPCDLLLKEGAESFRKVLSAAIDVLEFKLKQVWDTEAGKGVEGRRRAVDSVLRVLAAAPEMAGKDGQVKRELMVNRIARRFGLNEQTVWDRLRELRAEVRQRSETTQRRGEEPKEEERKAPAAPEERELLRVLLADPALVPAAAAEVTPEDIRHPGLRRLLEGLYTLSAAGQTPDLDHLQARIDHPGLISVALQMRDVGLQSPDREASLKTLLAEFRKRRLLPIKQELQNQLHAASDHMEAVELLRRLQDQTRDPKPGSPPAPTPEEPRS
jgi:DNA primase